MPSDALVNFQRSVCPDKPIDSIEFTYALIEEIFKIKKELKEADN